MLPEVIPDPGWSTKSSDAGADLTWLGLLLTLREADVPPECTEEVVLDRQEMIRACWFGERYRELLGDTSCRGGNWPESGEWT